MSITSLKASIKALLDTVSGIGRVELRKNIDGRRDGNVSWINDPTPGRAQWELHVKSRSEEDYGVGPQELLYSTMELEGWMPYAYSNPNTTPIWEALLESVCTKIRSNRSVSQTVDDCMLPQ